MSYNREYYLKLKEEKPEKIKENSKKAYEKLKQNPDKLKEYRHTSYENYKENNAEKLAESRRLAGKKYYEKNKEKVIAKAMERYYKLKSTEDDSSSDLSIQN